jgi:hypothetical protein
MKATHALLVLSDVQWKHTMSKFPDCLLLGARYEHVTGTLDTCGPGSAIIPVSPSSPLDETKPLVAGELFCGGFSGWTHAIHELMLQNMNIEHAFALDRDATCCQLYMKTHAPNILAWDPIGCVEAVAAAPQFGDRPSVSLAANVHHRPVVDDLHW